MNTMKTVIGTGTMALMLGAMAMAGPAHAQRAEARAHVTAEAGASGEHRSESEASARQRSRVEVRAEERRREARESLEDDGRRAATNAEVDAAVEAIAAGASTDHIVTIRERTPRDRDMTASLRALARITARGLPAAEASTAVAARVASGASDAELARFGATARSMADLTTNAPSTPARMGVDAAGGVRGTIGGLGGGLGAGVGAGLGATVGGVIGG